MEFRDANFGDSVWDFRGPCGPRSSPMDSLATLDPSVLRLQDCLGPSQLFNEGGPYRVYIFAIPIVAPFISWHAHGQLIKD